MDLVVKMAMLLVCPVIYFNIIDESFHTVFNNIEEALSEGQFVLFSGKDSLNYADTAYTNANLMGITNWPFDLYHELHIFLRVTTTSFK